MSSLISTDDFNIFSFDWNDFFSETINFFVGVIFYKFFKFFDKFLLIFGEIFVNFFFTLDFILKFNDLLELISSYKRIISSFIKELRYYNISNSSGDYLADLITHLTRIFRFSRRNHWRRTSFRKWNVIGTILFVRIGSDFTN